MANSSVDIRRKKFRRRGPLSKLWILCIVYLFMQCKPGYSSICQKTLYVYPEIKEVLYGTPLELYCVSDENYYSNSTGFYYGVEALTSETETINSTTIRMVAKHLEKNVYNFYCKNTVTKQVCPIRIAVDSTPMNVTDFSCISQNFEVLKCGWTHQGGPLLTEYKLEFNYERNSANACISRTFLRNRQCSWNTTSTPRYKQMEKYFNFTVKACNNFGCNTQNFNIDHFSVVKPDPPVGLKTLKNNTDSVLLEWELPINMVDFSHGVIHRIEYQIAKIDNTSYFRRVDTSSVLSKNLTNRFWLSNLPYAHMSYEVRIYIKTKEAEKEEFWSDFSYVMFTTASERPRRPPATVAGAFNQNPYSSKRVIFVYWTQLEEYEESGANFTYKVVYSNHGAKNPQTIFPERNKSMSYVILDEASLDAIDVSIWSMNTNGSSENSSYLYIPPRKDIQSLSVTSFTKLAYENGTYELSWVGIEKLDNYTLFWCQHNSTNICTGRMNFKTLDPHQNSHVIELPKNNRYQFAISANNGSTTSGMVWAICDISKDAIAMYGYPVKLDYGVPGKTSVNITWTMSCTLKEGIIIGYLIKYCPVLDTSNVCNTKEKELSFYISDPKQMAINVTHLKPYKTYKFTLALNTTYGLKEIENASTEVTMMEDTPSSPTNITISDIKSDSLNISWYPPLNKNGNIGKYVISINKKEMFTLEEDKDEKNKDDKIRSMIITGLKSFTNYSFTVEACNSAIRSCSVANDSIFVRTRIGTPGTMKPPKVLAPDIVEWEEPEFSGGPIDYYQIKIVVDDNSNYEIKNTTKLSWNHLHCEGVVSVVTYQVRAITSDEDEYHGTLADREEVTLPRRHNSERLEFPGEWSLPGPMTCGGRDGLTMTFIIMAAFLLVGFIYGIIKLLKKYRKMEDIKPVLPIGLGIPEKDNSKYAFGGWNPTTKDEKPSSDEMLLLPNSRAVVPSPESKQKDDTNCGSSDHTDSTALSDTSRGPVDRQTSTTSDEGSESSLQLEGEAERGNVNDARQEEDSSNSDVEMSNENSPYLPHKDFTKNPVSGYVQSVVSPTSGYVQSAPVPLKSFAPPASAPTYGSSYVMAGLPPPIFTTDVPQPGIQTPPPSGYVRAEDAQARSLMNIPKLRPSSTKLFGPESLPTMTTLPTPEKHGVDSSYIQLQSLDALTSHKQPVNTVPFKPPASSGYVSPAEAVINKHLNNMLSSQISEESAILDPTMSPDAYCRFSWSTDPANDNLHTLLADSSTINSTKN